MLKKFREYLSKKKFISLLIEVIGVVLIWRGVWGILDIYLFPNYPIASYLSSILIGFLFVWIDDRKLDELE
ncbi:MAG: hypothetical protein PHN66_01035 [Candidatus Shapirobacteria bacterium]|nr:hypothetical protein [Candidatus Shapirobacteria bacterium]